MTPYKVRYTGNVNSVTPAMRTAIATAVAFREGMAVYITREFQSVQFFGVRVAHQKLQVCVDRRGHYEDVPPDSEIVWWSPMVSKLMPVEFSGLLLQKYRQPHQVGGH